MVHSMHLDPTYNRTKGPDGEEIGKLGYDCGPHCGVTMAGTHQLVGHCEGACCHNFLQPVSLGLKKKEK